MIKDILIAVILGIIIAATLVVALWPLISLIPYI